MVRDSLDRYLRGVAGFGIPGFRGLDGTQPPATRPAFLDSYPSMLIAAMDYIEASGDKAWARRHYRGLQGWAEAMLAMDRDSDGLWSTRGAAIPTRSVGPMRTCRTGGTTSASATRTPTPMRWPIAPWAKWPPSAESIGQRGRAGPLPHRRGEAAQRLLPRLLQPGYRDPGGLADADGELHDYHFLWVNGVPFITV